MFHFRTAPFACAYRSEVVCPVSTALSELDDEQQGIPEALPCAVCPHYFDTAMERLAQRRISIGRLGRKVLSLASQEPAPFYPLTWALRTAAMERANLRRLWKAVQCLIQVCAVVAISLPTLVPRARNRQQCVLRETVWVQVTAVGRVLASHTFGLGGSRWRQEQQRVGQVLAAARERVGQTDLVAGYVQNLVCLLRTFTTHLMAATDPVIVAQCTQADAPYTNALVHLERIAPTACAEVDRVFLQAQAYRRLVFGAGRPAVQ